MNLWSFTPAIFDACARVSLSPRGELELQEAVMLRIRDGARFKVIPDMRWDHKEYIYAGNRAISVWTVVGKGADGEALNYQGCDIYTFRGGKICAKDTYWKIVEYKDRL